MNETKRQSRTFVAEGISVTYTNDVSEGKILDTEVDLACQLRIAGRDRQRFLDALQALIDEYQI